VTDLQEADVSMRFGAIFPNDDVKNRRHVDLRRGARASFWATGFVKPGERDIDRALLEADSLSQKGRTTLVTIAGHSPHQRRPRLSAVVILPVHHQRPQWGYWYPHWSAIAVTRGGSWQEISSFTLRNIALSTALAECEASGCQGLITLYPLPAG
jgi:hypothetical protein